MICFTPDQTPQRTVCPRSGDPSYIVTYYIKWVTTSWTDGIEFFLSNSIQWVDYYFGSENPGMKPEV